MAYVPILCLDFDGVIHSYKSGWKGADIIPDPIVPGAIEFIMAVQAEGWKVAIHSSRSNQPGGMTAMQEYLKAEFLRVDDTEPSADASGAMKRWAAYDAIDWPTEKPPATITLDDRAVTFAGKWPSMNFLKNFKPWTHNTKAEVPVAPEESEAISNVLRTIHTTLHLNNPIAIGVNTDGVLTLYKGTETKTEDVIEICKQLLLESFTELNGGITPKTITFVIGDPDVEFDQPLRGTIQ